MSAESVSDRPFASLTVAQLELRIAANRASQKEAAKHGNAAARKVLAELKRAGRDLVEERNFRDMPPSVPDAECIAMRLAEFDLCWPGIDANHSTVREVSSGECSVAQPLVGVGTEANETAARLPRA